MSDIAREQIGKLAKLVARDVFKLGDEPAMDMACRRIAFKLGEETSRKAEGAARTPLLMFWKHHL